MESSIKIGFVDNGKGLEPCINVIIVDTDDPRDRLVRTFFQALGGESSWLRVEFHSQDLNANKYVTLYPLRPEEMATAAEQMLGRLERGVTAVADDQHRP